MDYQIGRGEGIIERLPDAQELIIGGLSLNKVVVLNSPADPEILRAAQAVADTPPGAPPAGAPPEGAPHTVNIKMGGRRLVGKRRKHSRARSSRRRRSSKRTRRP